MRLQPRFDLGAPRFQKRRQRQFLAERLDRLVGGKARSVGGDLEQDAVGLAEIKTAKIKPVDLAGVNLLSRSRYVCTDICEEDAYATYEGTMITCYST
jgi:hypothetical protein